MKRCLVCASQLSEESRFCSRCGHSARSASLVPTLSLDEDARLGSDGLQRTPRTEGEGAATPLNLAPGTVLLERYRVLSILGRGGMGLVYRADDLKLGQPVALKFLPPSLARDPEYRERFLSEVRNARQVSHPNVCRVYDVAEANGHYFLSMEYVDGEDLSTLLARIGRLPPAKALEIAHELCAGLAAAHARQFVHRDLKPANIMIDGRGHARITDFGLAVAPEEARPGELAGTPSYMAPELFEGKPATVQSDIYALGVVLYELYTGKHPWDRRPATDSKRRESGRPPSSPSFHTPEIDSAVDRIILRCLEIDPTARPSSALQVGAALPGGNPLAMAIAAGETPSPEMVAAAGEEGGLSPTKAWTWLLATALSLAVAMFLAQHGLLVNLVPAKEPAVLFERAREIASSLGYNEVADSTFWYDSDSAYYPYSSELPAPDRYRSLARTTRSPQQFWYRQSPHALETTHDPFSVSGTDPSLFYSGEVEVGMDSAGRLIYYAAIAPQKEVLAEKAGAIDWSPLFQAAGLDYAQSQAKPAQWLPDVPADQNYFWEVQSNGNRVQVAGASYHDRIVFLQVFAPWTKPTRVNPVESPLTSRIGFGFFVACALTVVVLCVVFARRNLKQGRGDFRGAVRAAIAFFLAQFGAAILAAHYGTSPLWIWTFSNVELGLAACTALLFGAFYLALEPYIRRTWPEILISWNRLLAGGWRNPLVGRDFLIGVCIGVIATILLFIHVALPYWFPVANITALGIAESSLGPVSRYLSSVFGVSAALMNAMGTLAILFITAHFTRRKWVAVSITGLFLVVINLTGENLPVELPFVVAFAALMIFCLLRFGLLPLAVAWVSLEIVAGPLSTDLSRWYAWRGLFSVILLLAIALYGFRLAIAGKPAFGAAFEP